MNTRTKRIGSIASAVVAVGLIVGGTAAVASSIDLTPAGSEPAVVVTPTPEPTVTPTPEPTEASVVEAPAEPAPVEQQVVPAAPAPVAPAPVVEQPAAPAPEPAPVVPAPAPEAPVGGDQQAGECREYNDANECTAWYVP